MAEYLKRAAKTSATGASDVSDTVRDILAAIEAGGEDAARDYAKRFDRYEGEIVLGPDAMEAAGDALSQQVKDDIRFAHDNIRRFAEAQLSTVSSCEIELSPGFIAGQKHIPVASVGAYVPGGRYAHVASALMTVTTAKVAGVGHITACSPPQPGTGIPPAILWTMGLCGADLALALGGVQGVAAMTYGLFGARPADMLVGPGNQFVAEAKRQLFGRVGIDMVAGPTDLLVIADDTADAETVAVDLVGQAEHGYNSPVWLVSTDRALAEDVMSRMDRIIAALPQPNRDSAEAAWRDFAEVVVAETREEAAQLADAYAPEHLHVQAADLGWWLDRLGAYGSLFLGEETTVAFGDKASGPNHVLPTSGAARYTGGLSVQKFLKTVTWQRAERDAVRGVAEATARISRIEGMEGHARTADIRLARFFGASAS